MLSKYVYTSAYISISIYGCTVTQLFFLSFFTCFLCFLVFFSLFFSLLDFVNICGPAAITYRVITPLAACHYILLFLVLQFIHCTLY